jgi:hypothetical protein
VTTPSSAPRFEQGYGGATASLSRSLPLEGGPAAAGA